MNTRDNALPVLIPLAGLAGLLGGSLICLMVGLFRTPAVALVSIALAVAVVIAGPKCVTVAGRPTPRVVWVLLYGLIGFWGVFNAGYASELVVTGRDGATYLNIAKGYVESGEIRPAPFGGQLSSDLPLSYDAPGWVLQEDGRLYEQFLHAAPAAWAAIATVAGEEALYVTNIWIGAVALLAFFGASRRHLGSWAGLGATIMLACTFPFVYYSRSTFTEPAALALVAGGLWLATEALSRGNDRIATLAGLIFGLAAAVRLDAWMVGLSLSVLVWMAQLLDRNAICIERVWRGFLLGSALGALDLIAFSTPYLQVHRAYLLPLFLSMLAFRILALPPALRLAHRVAEWGRRWRFPTPTLAGVFMLATMVYLLAFRPFLLESRGTVYGLDVIERSEGLPLDSGRDYSELSAWWQTWYLGVTPVLLAAGSVIYTAWRGSWLSNPISRLNSIIIGIPALAYLFMPSANPDHPWVMRRFLPVLIPGIAAAAWWVWERIDIRGVRASALLRGAVALSLLAGPLPATAPLLLAVDGDGARETIAQLCRVVGDSPVVIVEDAVPVALFLLQPIARWCAVPVAQVPLSALDDLSTSIEGTFNVLTAERALLDGFPDTEIPITSSVSFIHETLTAPPSEVRDALIELYAVRLAGP